MVVIDIEYESQKVEKLFKDLCAMERKIGKEITRAVKMRIDAMRAAPTYDVIMTLGLGKPHALHGDMKGYNAISASANVRLIYMVNGDTIIVKGVCDYHGGKINWLIP